MSKLERELSIFRTLKFTPFFYDLTPEEFSEIAGEIKTYTLKSETLVIKECERGRSIFFVIDGMVRATIVDPSTGKNVLLGKLGVGDFFGELSFLTGRLRSATVTTLLDTELMEISSSLYEKVAMKYSAARRFLIDLCRQHELKTAETIKSLHVDRRRYPRVKCNGNVMFQRYDKNNSGKVIKLEKGLFGDISEEGISFHMGGKRVPEDDFEMLGKEYKAKIEIEELPFAIKVLGMIVSVERSLGKTNLDDFYVVRMKFLKIDKNDLKAFNKVLKFYWDVCG